MFVDYKNKREQANQIYEYDIDVLERIWNSVFFEGMYIDPNSTPLFLINSAFFTEKLKENLIELIFEKFNFPKMYSTISNVTGIFAEGKTTGVSLDIGYLGSTCIRVFEGFPEYQDAEINNFGTLFLGTQYI